MYEHPETKFEEVAARFMVSSSSAGQGGLTAAVCNGVMWLYTYFREE
jgi:hypothetical protein